MAGAKSSGRIPVCILSTHPLVLEEFSRLLPRPAFQVCGRQLEPREAAALKRNTVPEARVYVVDAHAPRPVTESLLAALAEQFPGARLLLVGDKFPEVAAFAALRVGARGLLRFADAKKQLARAVEAVAGGGFWVPRPLLSRFVDDVLDRPRNRRRVRPTNLSRREQEVFEGLIENLANKEIAAKLNISERTVKFHVSNVLAKFGLRRRADLIVHCLQSQPGPA